MKITKHYSDFLQQLNWNYFITCRTPYKIHTMTVRNWITKLLKTSNKVENVFYVSERDKGDYQPIYDSEDVCKYVSKHIGENVDYDIVFKEIS